MDTFAYAEAGELAEDIVRLRRGAKKVAARAAKVAAWRAVGVAAVAQAALRQVLPGGWLFR
jgi:hypothetical protein